MVIFAFPGWLFFAMGYIFDSGWLFLFSGIFLTLAILPMLFRWSDVLIISGVIIVVMIVRNLYFSPGPYYMNYLWGIVSLTLFFPILTFVLPVIGLPFFAYSAWKSKSNFSFFSSDPPEVREAIAALDSIEVEFSGCLGIESIKQECSEWLKKNPDKFCKAVSEKGIAPREVLYIIMRNMVANKLISGHFHVYRGVLSMQGDGFYAIWKRLTEKMLKLGIVTPDEVIEDREYLQKEISEMG